MRLTRLTALRGVALLLTVMAAIGLVVAPGPFTTPTLSSAPLRPLPATDVNPLGATMFLDREVEPWKREQTVKMARDAGIGWAKIMFAWQEIEPKPGRYYDDRYRKSSWEKFDEIVALLEEYSIRPIARLDKPPEWALASSGEMPIRDIQEYASYVGEVAKRYRGRIQHYQIWNEPNLATEWGGRTPNAANYVRLLTAASNAIHAADPNALVLSGPLAQTTERSARATPDPDYLAAMYDAGAAPAFDVLFANAYGFDRPPADAAGRESLNFQRVTLLREEMVRRGDGQKPVWLNEFGWNAAPASFPPARLTSGRVTEDQQAAFTGEAIAIARGWDWLGVINLWYFRQVGDMSPSESADYYFRIVDTDFTPRLVYYTLQKIASGFRAAAQGIHQETSPAVEYRGHWRHARSSRATAGGYLITTTAGDTLTFEAVGDTILIDLLTGPAGGTVQVKIDGYDSPELARDANGRAFISLNAPAAGRASVPVAKGLKAGRHTVQLTVLDGEVAIDGFVVQQSSVSYWPFYGQVGLAALGVLALLASFVIRRHR